MIHTSRHDGLQGFGADGPQPIPKHIVEAYFPRYRLQSVGAFGKTITIAGQKINIPIEGLAEEAALAAVNAAWPVVQQKIYAELPVVVDRALNRAQPRIRKEVDYAVDLATSRAAMVATGLAVVFVAGAWWVRRAVKKG